MKKNKPLRVLPLDAGPLPTNCYLVHREGHSPCAVIDPGGDADRIAQTLRREALEPSIFLITHGHYDHVGGLAELAGLYPSAEIACHAECGRRMKDPEKNFSALFGIPLAAPEAGRTLSHGEEIRLPGVRLLAIHVPGHAPGHLAFYAPEDGVLFAGDVLFREGVGRTDLPGSSWEALRQSLSEQILVLPEETLVYPGHGPATTIGHEKRHNPFLTDLFA
ncbi:MAG: MBL fold metallo-hydrolase [Planctomycetota bacterium]